MLLSTLTLPLSLPWPQVMGELDEKKRTALEQTWLKVNEDFGSIFGTLLPGTTAKLEPQEGKSFLEGESQARLQKTSLAAQLVVP